MADGKGKYGKKLSCKEKYTEGTLQYIDCVRDEKKLGAKEGKKKKVVSRMKPIPQKNY